MSIPSVINMAGLVPRYGNGVTLRRSRALTFDSSTGRFAQPISFEPDVTITAVVYRTIPREAAILPEGVRNKQLITIFTSVQLFAARSDVNKDGDIIIYRSEAYEVIKTEDWYVTGNYFKSIAVRIAPSGVVP